MDADSWHRVAVAVGVAFGLLCLPLLPLIRAEQRAMRAAVVAWRNQTEGAE